MFFLRILSNMDNVFRKVSKVSIKTKKDRNRTILDDVYFTAPFKIMRPFYIDDDYIKIVVMSSSAGIMAGDRQEYNINVGQDTKLEVTSQSYEKIHKMNEGKAVRYCEINVDENAFLKYNPQPTIPFAESYFESKMQVNLQDESSKVILTDIISCGRSNSGEKFQYKSYHSFMEVRCKGKIIYRDNTLYDPNSINMNGYGFFEGYTHLANIFIGNFNGDEKFIEEISKLIDEDIEVTGGVTLTEDKDVSIKILGYSGQKLSDLSDEIMGWLF